VILAELHLEKDAAESIILTIENAQTAFQKASTSQSIKSILVYLTLSK
jgi:hypothetical protein